jgi:hypothetical protein
MPFHQKSIAGGAVIFHLACSAWDARAALFGLARQ